MDELLRRTTTCARAYAFRLPGELVDRLTQRTDELTRRVSVAVTTRLSAAVVGVERLMSELRLADPAHIMARGFAAVSLIPSLSPVRSVDNVSGGSAVRVTVADGSFDCEVRSVAEKPGRTS
jgi:exonuclease VII large subunit